MNGGLLVTTLTVILPLPILSYWSINVILDEILSPDAVPEPLKSNPKVNAPVLLTANWALEEEKEVTAWLPNEPEYVTPRSPWVPVLPFTLVTMLVVLVADSIIRNVPLVVIVPIPGVAITILVSELATCCDSA